MIGAQLTPEERDALVASSPIRDGARLSQHDAHALIAAALVELRELRTDVARLADLIIETREGHK